MSMKLQIKFLLMCGCILAALSETVLSKSDVGCWADTNARDLPFERYMDDSGGNTLDNCAMHCYNKGFLYAGAQFGFECSCGNSYGRYGPSTKCNMVCPGDHTNQTICGGGYSNSVMSTGFVSPKSDVGCWADADDRDLPYERYMDDSGANTLDSCAMHCYNRGYLYAGAQFGFECSCGYSYGRYGPSTKCNMVCPGDHTNQTICGGEYSNSVMSTGFVSPKSDVGCWADADDRDLPYEPYMDDSGGNTLDSCAMYCYNMGFLYAGAQSGFACFCGNSYGRYGPSTNCNMVCPGDHTNQTICGGGYSNSVMSTGLVNYTAVDQFTTPIYMYGSDY